LFQRDARNGKSEFKFTVVLLDQVQHHIIGGKQTAFCHSADYIFIGKIVVIIMISADIKETIAFETKWLMDLKVKTDGFHVLLFFYLVIT